MFRKILLAIIMITLLLYIQNLTRNENSRKGNTDTNGDADQVLSIDNDKDDGFAWSNNLFNASWFYINNINNLVLIPNLDSQKASSEIIDAKGCLYLGSAGFYSEDNNYIGLLKVKNILYSNYTKNDVFNGIFSITANGDTVFSDMPLTQDTSLSIQTGPFIVKNRIFQNLDNFNKDSGRRLLLLKSEDDKLLFLTIYRKNSTFDGPTISQIPLLLGNIATQQNWKIIDAINLDGGTASTFKNNSLYLKELSTVGSFFCYMGN